VAAALRMIMRWEIFTSQTEIACIAVSEEIIHENSQYMIQIIEKLLYKQIL
jgi:hypothetical protein